jgi:hypothetical protein
MKVIAATFVLLVAIALGGWFASGRDFRSFRDGLSRDFRKVGAEVLNINDARELDAALEKAVKKAKTDADRVVYRKLEFYSDQSAKALNETDAARASLLDNKPDIAQMQLEQAELHVRFRRACLAELHDLLPDPTGQRQPPPKADIGDAVCRQY